MPTYTKPYTADWKDESRYPPTDCTDPHRIAWEFVRRHPDYARHAEQMRLLVASNEYETGIKRNSPSILDGVDCWPTAMPGETAKVFFDRMKENGIKRPRIDRPCNSFTNRWALKAPVNPLLEAYTTKEVVFIKHEVKMKRHKQLETKAFSLFIYPNESAARFRLDLPIKPQIEIASKKLKAMANCYSIDASAARRDLRIKLASIAKKELTKDILNKAHYILRSYDASKIKRRELLHSTDPNKRALQSGSKEQTRVFNAQRKALGEQIFMSTRVKEFPKQADEFIEGKKFLLLLWPIAEKKS